MITTLISQINEVGHLEAAKLAKKAKDERPPPSSSAMVDDGGEEKTAEEKEIALLMDGVAEEFAAGCTLEEEQMAAQGNDLLRILPDLHNVARVGFVGNMRSTALNIQYSSE